MSSAVSLIQNVISWGFWLGVRGFLKPAVIFFLVVAIDAYTVPPISLGKFNRMLVGESATSHSVKLAGPHACPKKY